jgi:hypothetical protein
MGFFKLFWALKPLHLLSQNNQIEIFNLAELYEENTSTNKYGQITLYLNTSVAGVGWGCSGPLCTGYKCLKTALYQ